MLSIILLLAEGADAEHVAGHRPHLGLGVLAARPAAHTRPDKIKIKSINSAYQGRRHLKKNSVTNVT